MNKTLSLYFIAIPVLLLGGGMAAGFLLLNAVWTAERKLDAYMAQVVTDGTEANEELKRTIGDSINSIVEDHLPTLQNHLQALEDRLQALENREGRLSTLENRLQALEGRFPTLENRLQALDGRLSTLGNRVGSLESWRTRMQEPGRPLVPESHGR